MQYFLRFYLCVMVVVSHFWSSAFSSPEGGFAVMGFYVISGYVITMALVTHYLKIEGGVKLFWINRFLRLYPTYAFCALFGFVVISLFPNVAEIVNPRMVLPESEAGALALEKRGISPSLWWLFYVQQIALISQVTPFEFRSPIQFAPTAWSVNMELYYYFVLSMGATASIRNASLFLKVAIAFVVGYLVLFAFHEIDLIDMKWGRPFLSTNYETMFYRTFLGVTIFFALGGLAYHLRKFNIEPKKRWLITTLILILPFIDVGGAIGQTVGYILFGIGVATIIRMWPDERPKGFLKFLGDISYPLFLVHWPVAVIVTATLGLEKNSFNFLAVAGVFSIFSAAVLVIVLERPIEAVRQKVRMKA